MIKIYFPKWPVDESTLKNVVLEGPFNNYVDKMMEEGSKNVYFAQDIKTVHVGGGGQKWQNSVHVLVEWFL